MHNRGPLLFLLGALSGCSSSEDQAASWTSGAGGAGGYIPVIDLDGAIESSPDATPHVIDGTSLGCPCTLTVDFTALEAGDHAALTVQGVAVRVTDAATDAAVDVPIAVAANTALGGMHVLALADSSRSAIVVPPAGQFCVVVEYIPTTTSVPTMKVAYGGSREFVAGPAGSGTQSVLTPTPGLVNMVVLRMTPAVDSVRITPGPGGGVEVPAICFGTDAPTM
jgi:hypothetical protein